jgi:hypothetical protein
MLGVGEEAGEPATTENAMMSRALCCVPFLALVLAAAPAAHGATAAAEPPPEAEEFELQEIYEPSAGAIAGAIAINIVYAPVRFAVTVVGAALGGLQGVISAGNKESAWDIWRLTDGSQIITPAMLEGRERWTFSGYGW